MTTTFVQHPCDMGERIFLTTFAGVYESSPWIADKLWHKFAEDLPGDVDSMARALAEIVDTSTPDQKLALIRAHPDLAGRAALAGQLTSESQGEQAGAGLDQCSAEELSRFQDLNERYRTTFGFPFIMAVKGADRHQILKGFAERIDNDGDTELARAIEEIHKIARLRLEEIARNG